MNHRERQRTKEREELAASIADYISQCDDALRAEQERCNGAWPDRLTVPLWPGRVERVAFVHWLDEIRAKSGKTIGIDFEPPLSGSETTGEIARLH
jgi:hypothetical protein